MRNLQSDHTGHQVDEKWKDIYIDAVNLGKEGPCGKFGCCKCLDVGYEITFGAPYELCPTCTCKTGKALAIARLFEIMVGPS